MRIVLLAAAMTCVNAPGSSVRTVAATFSAVGLARCAASACSTRETPSTCAAAAAALPAS